MHATWGSLVGHCLLAEARIDRLFQTRAEATQEAVHDQLSAAETMVGGQGHRRIGLAGML